jgi:hypothetical protein
MIEVVVTLAESAETPVALAGLAGKGFHLTQDLATLGMLIGQADEGALARLRDVPGVLAVEPSVPVSLPPEGPQ